MPRSWSGVLARVGAPVASDESGSVEWVLAAARVALTSVSLGALWIRSSSFHPSPLFQAACAGYAIAGLGLLLVLRVRPELSARVAPAAHALDLAWATALAASTAAFGITAPLFPGFVLVAAASRWGLRETAATAAATAVLLVTRETIVGRDAGMDLPRSDAVWLAGGLIVLALPLGRLAEREKRIRGQVEAAARTMGKVRLEAGLTGTLQAVLEDLLALFGAGGALLVAYQAEFPLPSGERRRRRRPGRLLLWDAHLPTGGGEAAFHARELDVGERDTYLFPAPEECWYARERRRDTLRVFDVIGLSGESTSVVHAVRELPPRFLEAHPFRSLLAVSGSFGEEWDDRVFLFDPTADASELHFLRALVRQVGPAVYNIHLLSRLHAQVSADERARVARELHDGITQSLIGLEMEIAACRRERGPDPGAVPARLEHIQRLLRQEILNLRDLMQQMKPLYLDPQHLLDFFADLVSGFQRATGINAHFVTDVQQVAMAPPICSELARIAQEALVNVRRHSGAANVLVRFTADDGHWSLVVDDDGRGFPFAGRYGQTELDEGRKGPLVIKERVRAIGGELTIDSRPGHGARLEVSLPRASA